MVGLHPSTKAPPFPAHEPPWPEFAKLPVYRAARSTVMAVTIDAGWHPLVGGSPPNWVSGWGQDQFGVYVAFTIGMATQRLRWIPPGRFWMGSPDDEDGRYDNEDRAMK